MPPPCLPQVLQDMVPPKKHLLRHQPANAQIGLMEGNTFCTTLQPRLFTMDLNVVEHKVFYTEVGARRGWGHPRASGSPSARSLQGAWGGGGGRRVSEMASEVGGLLSPWSSVSLHREPCSSGP